MQLCLLGVIFASQDELYMKSNVVKFDYKYFNSLKLFVGTGDHDKNHSLDLEISLGRSNTLIGNKSGNVNWGVDCPANTPDKSSSCQISDKSSEQIQFIYNRQISTVPAEMYLRLDKSDTLSEFDQQKIPKMKFDLVTKQQDDTWQLDDWGILGLSPKGQFFSYLRNLYSSSDKVELALKHTLSEADSDNDSLRFKVQPYLNPSKEQHYGLDDVIGTFDVPEGDDYWSIRGSIGMDGTQFKYDNQKICMSTMVNELFGVIDSLVWCDTVKKMVCDGDTKHCTKSKADLTKAPFITLNLGERELKFNQDDYIFFIDDDLNCRIGDICDPRSEGSCDNDTEVVLGKLFFEKFTPMLSLDVASGAASVSLIQFFKAPKETVVIWLIIAIICVVFAVAGLVYMIVKQKLEDNKAQKDDQYVSVNSGEEEEEDKNEA